MQEVSMVAKVNSFGSVSAKNDHFMNILKVIQDNWDHLINMCFQLSFHPKMKFNYHYYYFFFIWIKPSYY